MKVIPNAKRSDRSRLASLVAVGTMALVILSPKHLNYAGRSGYWFGAKSADDTITILSTKPCAKLADARSLAVAQYRRSASYIPPEKDATITKTIRKRATKAA